MNLKAVTVFGSIRYRLEFVNRLKVKHGIYMYIDISYVDSKSSRSSQGIFVQ